MKTKTLTHIARVRLESLTQSGQVMELLGWNWDQYTGHQFEQYLLFVDKVCQGWPRVREEILYSPVFRGFWINEWNIRTAIDWLPMAIDNQDNHAWCFEEYLHLHNHIRLMGDQHFDLAYHHTLGVIRKGGRK